MKRTPLYKKHVEMGGKLVEFGGWELPVEYSGILEEHRGVRGAAGLFDVSHMGEILVEGPGAMEFLQEMVTNDIAGMHTNQMIYTPMCYEDGGTVDDLIVCKLEDDSYMLVVNASNTEKDYTWLAGYRENGVCVSDVSCEYAQLALQGPEAEKILQKLTEFPLSTLKFFYLERQVGLNGVRTMVARSGYTGEDGFEIYIEPGEAENLWEALLEAGKDRGLVPAGLGARDTLRFEAALPLYGHELSANISPLEAGLGRYVKLGKENFIGREALKMQQERGVERRLIGIEMVDRGIPRSGYEVLKDGNVVGNITSGTYSPSLEKNLGLALADSRYATEDGQFYVNVRGRHLRARTVKTPFYSKKYKKI